MKTKKFSKKLVLNKATVANLNNDQMNVLRGGVTWTSIGVPHLCHTRCETYCPTGVCCVKEESDNCIPTG